MERVDPVERLTQILWSVWPDEQRRCGGVQFYFSQLTNVLVIANSSLNVVIYMTFNTRFRQVRHRSGVGYSHQRFPQGSQPFC